MAGVSYGSLPFNEAIAFFRRKLNLPTQSWTDIWESDHDIAFVVAGANRDDLVADFRAAVDAALAGGETLADFQQRFDAIVAKYGWDYNGSRNWRSRVIYETNLRTAYAAGRYQQLQEIKSANPYWEFHHTPVAHPRILHMTPTPAGWNGLILHADDPWWNEHFPPCGWGCQCVVYSHSADDLATMGKSGPDPAPETKYETKTVGTRGPHPRTVETPEGVDPGFGYTPGKSTWMQAQAERAGERELQAQPLPQPRNTPADFGRPKQVPVDPTSAVLLPRASNLQDVLANLTHVIGLAGSKVYTDPTQTAIAVTTAIVQHIADSDSRRDGREQYFALIPELIENPFEIWISLEIDDNGVVFLRRRYIKAIQIGKKTIIGLVADSVDCMWVGLTFFRGGFSSAKNLRKGWLVYGR